MLKRLLLASTATAVIGASALAADLPSRRAPAPFVAVPVFTWTGFYIGGNAGYAFTTQRNAVVSAFPGAGNAGAFASGRRPAFLPDDAEGFTGGGQIGYNYQFGSFVIGLEADAAYTDLSSRRFVNTNGSPGTLASTNFYRHDLDFLGTVRGRVGYAFDRLLVYGTGGFAYGDVTISNTFYNTTSTTSVISNSGGRARLETGWAAGGGVEYALPTSFSLLGSSAVTIKAEALYYDLGRNRYNSVSAAGAPQYIINSETNGVIARAGLNFKFGTF